MKKINPRLTWIILVGVLILSVTGCGEQEPPLEPVTISFVHQDFEREYYEPLAEEFMQLHPEITVELTAIRGGSFEAYSQAVPVIATASGGVCEIVEDGETGFLTPPGDSLRLAQAMSRLCDDRSLLARQSANALNRISAFSLESRVAAYLAAIRQSLELAA